uniref:Putative PD-(D/E)XK nuclease superfamily protein n=1 Tax=viral metagenome TaxID=1070528 RepID=A0A6M3MAJ0_9ZZZZ
MEKWSHTKIDTFIRCPEMYRWRYIIKIKPKQKARPLALGACIASSLSAFRDKGTFDAASEAFMQTWVKEGRVLASTKEEDPLRSVERALEILDKYIKEYPDEPNQIIKPEINFDEEIAPDIFFRGRIDGVIRDRNGVGIIEDKTASRLGDYFFVEKGNSYQLKWYLFIANKLGLFELSDKNLPRGVLNAIYIHPKEYRFRREPVLKMKKEVEDAGKDLLAWIRHIRCSVDQANFPKADYNICSQYGGCDYLPLRRASGEILRRTLEANYVKSDPEMPEPNLDADQQTIFN